MTEEKYVTYRHLKKGQEISGAKQENSWHSFKGYVKEVNAAYVILELWNPGGPEERFPSEETLFGIEMTEEEIKEKYNQMAGTVVKAIQNRLENYEIGYHEIFNSWLSSDPWEMAQACVKKNLTIIGSCYNIPPKHAMFSGELLDVGICAEDEAGDRFWCHFKSDSVEVMKRRYERYQGQKKRKRMKRSTERRRPFGEQGPIRYGAEYEDDWTL